jgi:chemotaxis signal transduction protein
MPTTDRAAQLRHAFDLSFAEAPASGLAAVEDLLNIRLGATRYALRINEIAGLFADVKITPLPTTVPELLGISGLRGFILPVYDLRALLGHVVDTTPRWLAIAAATSVGLAFDAFEGQVRVAYEAIVPHDHGNTGVRHVREVVQLNGVTRSMVSVASVLEEITTRARTGGFKKE